MKIIDSCDYPELRRFNALLSANQTMTIGQQIEAYYNSGESPEHRRKRIEMMIGKGQRVADKIAAIVASWKREKPKEEGREGDKRHKC